MSFSIVIPTFQRRQIVRASIGTALAFARATSDSEVIVVDDASSDGTVEMIRAAYTREIESGLLVVVQRVTNGGAMAAKNAGARSARGDWLIFLDSDDQLLPIASQAITAFAARYKTTPVLFFRCQDEAGYLVGPAASAGPLDLDTLLRRGHQANVFRLCRVPHSWRIPTTKICASLKSLPISAWCSAMARLCSRKRWHGATTPRGRTECRRSPSGCGAPICLRADSHACTPSSAISWGCGSKPLWPCALSVIDWRR